MCLCKKYNIIIFNNIENIIYFITKNHRFWDFFDAILKNEMEESTGADPGFQVRGGALKKMAPSGGRRENFGGISCEKSRFYAKISYYFQLIVI
jgi:hypothetical protein